MALVRTFTLPHYEQYPVQIALFKNLKNTSYIRSQLLEANPDFDYAFLDAEMILSPTHLLTATFLSLHAILTARQKTRTPHSELVFRLSPNNNIGESYKKFGLGPHTTNLIAVKYPLTSKQADSVAPNEHKVWDDDGSVTNQSVSEHLGRVVEGECVKIGEEGWELGAVCDVERVRKAYKVNGGGGKKGKKGAADGDDDKKDERKELESVILGIMTLKGS
ncbi:CGI-121-domain-containing protein [Ophiobolus disseminans]|uniref:EKC/KEOPS complex subunit CGI121 n=1 Tax=Ophiobolus disseminans TaxID=1469910 RepID=A0A6A6ZNF1_9PLEO|nr:CGI-121-domain-containing protein [Ophiobolus disseminans]